MVPMPEESPALRTQGPLGAVRLRHGADSPDGSGHGRPSESALCRLAEEAGGVDGRTPFWRQRRGTRRPCRLPRAYVEELAEGTASLINILRPEAVAFGGGVAGRRSICCWSPCAAGSGR